MLRIVNGCYYVVFDVETTGLSAVYDTIIELAAVKIHKGNVIDTLRNSLIQDIHCQKQQLI